MLGWRFIKARATDYVFLYSSGRLAHQGAGLTGVKFAPFATGAVVPVDARDDVFAVEGVSSDFQTVTIQGLLSHRIADPKAAVQRQDFSVNLFNMRPLGEPMKQISERLKAIAQTAARETLAKATLDDALTKSAELSAAIITAIRADAGVSAAGVAIERVLVLSIRPAPEIRKALEADIREKLLRKADGAVFERRREAAEDEHNLKMRNESNALQFAQAELANAKSLEGERLSLAEARAATVKAQAATEADAERMRLAPWSELPPQKIAALALNKWAASNGSLTSLTLSGDALEKIADSLNART